VEIFESRSDMRELGSFNNCTSERVLDVLKSFGCVEDVEHADELSFGWMKLQSKKEIGEW